MNALILMLLPVFELISIETIIDRYADAVSLSFDGRTKRS